MVRIFNRSFFIAFSTSLLLLGLTACVLKKGSVDSSANEIKKKKSLRIEFEIILDEIVKKESLNEEDLRKYWKSVIPATLKQINKTDKVVELYNPTFIVYENFEIKNIIGEKKNDLIRQYDYTPVFDPETYESETVLLESNEYFLDTLNLVSNFNFYLGAKDTFLIRVKNYHLNEEIYSNWDTLIIK